MNEVPSLDSGSRERVPLGRPRDIPAGSENSVFDLRQASFTFVSVEGSRHSLLSVAKRIAARATLPQDFVLSAIEKELPLLTESVTSAVRNAFLNSSEWKGEFRADDAFRLLTLKVPELRTELSEYRNGRQIVSLSPEVSAGGDLELDIARLFSLGAEQQVGFVPRNGTPLWAQLDALLKNIPENDRCVTLADDHVFSGATLKRVIRLLEQIGIKVDRTLSFTQVGNGSGGPANDAAVKFSAGNRDPLSLMDLIDFEDFMIGFGGCRVSLPGDEVGIVPYCFPFGNPSSRASIPESAAAAFSEDVLKANLDFLERVQASLGVQLTLGDCVSGFRNYCWAMKGALDSDTLESILRSSLQELERNRTIYSTPKLSGSSPFASIRMPSDLILLDVNGTLFAPGETDIDPLFRGELRQAARRASALGVQIGLCSDSPLSGLKALSKELQLRGPILAEMGSIVSFEDAEPISLRVLTKLSELKAAITDFAEREGLSQRPDRMAVEFKGDPNAMDSLSFAFGADRKSSLSVFASAEFITKLTEAEDWKALAGQEISIDSNPDTKPYGYFAIHPVSNLTQAKAGAVREFGSLGVRVTMIGDSESDIVASVPNAKTILVSNSTFEAQDAPMVMRTRLPYVAGVLQAIELCLNEIEQRGKVK